MDRRNVMLALGVGALLLFTGLGYAFGRQVPFAQQAPLFEALRSTASIVFAVIGAWLAIVYPERLRMGLRGSLPGSQASNSDANVGLLLRPAIHSTFLIIVLLIVGVLVPIIKLHPWAQANIEHMRGVSYALLVFLTCWEIWIVFSTLFSTDLMQRQAAADRLRKSLDARFRR